MQMIVDNRDVDGNNDDDNPDDSDDGHDDNDNVVEDDEDDDQGHILMMMVKIIEMTVQMAMMIRPHFTFISLKRGLVLDTDGKHLMADIVK